MTAPPPERHAETSQDTAPRKRGWRPRRLHFHLGIWSILAIAAVGLFLLLASMSLTGRAIVLPNWVAERVETEMNTAMPQGSITLRRIEFGVTPKGWPRLRLVDVGLRDASGLDIAQLNSIEGGVRVGPLLRGELVPRTAILSGAQITFRRLSDGTFALQFGRGGTATGNLADMLDAMDAVFVGGILEDASRVEALGLTITLEDARSGRLWQVTDGRLSVHQTDQIIETQVTFDVFNQTDELAEVELNLRSSKADSAASLSVDFSNAAAQDIGAQTPALSFLSVVDAPIDGALRTTISADGKISDLAGALEINEGAIKPEPGATPVAFGGARGYVDYDPQKDSLELSGLTFTSELGEIALDGQLLFTNYHKDWPQSILAQLRLNEARLVTPELFDAPVVIDQGFADMRINLSPFSIDFGQTVLFRGDTRYEMTGGVSAKGDDWKYDIDLRSPDFTVEELKKVWPKTAGKLTREWVVKNLNGGRAEDAHFVLFGNSADKMNMVLSVHVVDTNVRMSPDLPVAENATGTVTLVRDRLAVDISSGTLTAPNGVAMDASGTTFVIPDVFVEPAPAEARIVMEGPAEGAFSLLEAEPFTVFEGTGYGPDVADGYMQMRADVRFLLLDQLPWEEIDFSVEGEMRDVTSDELVAGSTLAADKLDFTVSPTELTIKGAGRLGEVDIYDATWTHPFGPGAEERKSIITGSAAFGEALVRELDLGLDSSMVVGDAPAEFTLELPEDASPILTARTDLVGVGLTIAAVDWSKPRTTPGDLTLTATLGLDPSIDAMRLEAPGMLAEGSLTTAGGDLERLALSRVKVGDWLDAPVTMTGRPGAPVVISLDGGRVDLRNAGFSMNGDGGPNPDASPLLLRLDEVVVSDGIALQNFAGEFDRRNGMRGPFTAQVSNGAPISGSIAPGERGAVYRIRADDGGAVLKGLGVFSMAQGGDLQVLLRANGSSGNFEGQLQMNDTRLVDAPVVAEMLSAISVIGLLDQLNGPGIGFTEVKARFNLSEERLTLYSSSAVSASLGLAMDGYYDFDTSSLDMQGTLSPFYLINSLGRVMSLRDGEGLVGFNFTLTGPDDDVEVGVNPLSLLTPGMFREIFRREAPQQVTEE
jgi:hypothetical protein